MDILEDSYSVTRTIDGQDYFLSLTDTAGQEEYRGLWAASNLRSDAFLLVYDITQSASLDALDYFLQMIDMECDHRQDSGAVQPVKIVAGNKCDLKDARTISASQGLEWARGRGCGFMETSAREMVNIEETFARESMGYSSTTSTLHELNLCDPRSHRPPCRRRPANSHLPTAGSAKAISQAPRPLQPRLLHLTNTPVARQPPSIRQGR